MSAPPALYHRQVEPFPFDLFGDVIVTATDVAAWLIAVARIEPDSPRAAHYVRAWCVVDKIKRAKIAGEFEQITAPRHPPPEHWWARFRWR